MKKEYALFDWRALGREPVIGVDEVGRGCLAGRVYAAAVCLDQEAVFEHYTDSKLLSEKRRREYSLEIKRLHKYCIAYANVEEIATHNILGASLLAMKRAVEGLGISSGIVLVDGNKEIRELDSAYRQITLVKGDLRAHPVAAAAILAKVERDKYITELGLKYPQYGFADHKAYPTKSHKDSIAVHGPCEEHRKDFRGVREFWG